MIQTLRRQQALYNVDYLDTNGQPINDAEVSVWNCFSSCSPTLTKTYWYLHNWSLHLFFDVVGHGSSGESAGVISRVGLGVGAAEVEPGGGSGSSWGSREQLEGLPVAHRILLLYTLYTHPPPSNRLTWLIYDNTQENTQQRSGVISM